LHFGSVDCTRDMMSKSSAGFRFLCSWYSKNQREKFWFQDYLLFCFVKDLNSDELFSCSKKKKRKF
jgi:hypothetical protein